MLMELPFYLHPLDIPVLESVKSYAHVYGFPSYEESPIPNQMLADQQELVFDDIKIKVLFAPGHCPGHVVLYFPEYSIVVNGDGKALRSALLTKHNIFTGGCANPSILRLLPPMNITQKESDKLIEAVKVELA